METLEATVVRSPKIAARRQAVRQTQRRRRRRVAVGIAVAVGVTAGGWALSTSAVFGITSIQVTGLHALQRADVVAASGLRVGENAVGLPLAAALEGVKALPGVRDARIERAGSLGVRIIVVERAPALIVRAGDARVTFDQDGHAMGAFRGATGSNGPVPVLVLPPAPAYSVAFPPVPAAQVTAVLTVWRALGERLHARLGSFVPLDADGVTFRLDGVKVLFGGADHVRQKIAALRAVQQRVASEGHRLISIDLRAPARPAARIA